MDRMESLDKIYPICRSLIEEDKWRKLVESCSDFLISEADVSKLSQCVDELGLPEFLPELMLLERTKYNLAGKHIEISKERDIFELNPTLEVFSVSWNLADLFDEKSDKTFPEKQQQWIMCWRDVKTGQINIKSACDEDLLAVKIAVEDIDIQEAAKQGNVPEQKIRNILRYAARKGIILAPTSKLQRELAIFADNADIPEKYLSANTFTLQWHITNACDLHCKHCYDRSKRSPLTLEQGIKILDDMKTFCETRNVRGHICFSGGNPFLSKYFFGLYSKAAERGFSTSILGNPVSREFLQKMIDIQMPGYFQVSLEGLREHNDYIRGEGYYFRVIEFLGLLRDMKISSAVMLTLTKDNIDQILPLAEKLRGHSEYFTFNRLSLTGEGARLQLPEKEKFLKFLENYISASEKNPIMGFKDNLINIILRNEGERLFDGCTGYGCGAAFNFITVLPDGEAHACRKFPSLIGNVIEQSIGEVYDSEKARAYRRGAGACNGCDIRHVCGGCMAITNSFGLDIFTQKDPYCNYS